MNYRDTWDLSTIPDDKLKSEWGRRNAIRKGKKDVAPDKRKLLDKKADSMRRLRAERKANEQR